MSGWLRALELKGSTHPVHATVAGETLHNGHPVGNRERHEHVRGEADRDNEGGGSISFRIVGVGPHAAVLTTPRRTLSHTLKLQPT